MDTHKIYFLLFFLFFAFSTTTFAQTKTNPKQQVLEINSLPEQAASFSIRIGNLLGLTEQQIKKVETYRLEYLKDLQRVTKGKTVVDGNMKKNVSELQIEYDKKFGALLTNNQKNKIMRREFNY